MGPEWQSSSCTTSTYNTNTATFSSRTASLDETATEMMIHRRGESIGPSHPPDPLLVGRTPTMEYPVSKPPNEPPAQQQERLQSQPEPKPQRPGKKRLRKMAYQQKQLLSPIERICHCLEHCQFTGSVLIRVEDGGIGIISSHNYSTIQPDTNHEGFLSNGRIVISADDTRITGTGTTKTGDESSSAMDHSIGNPTSSLPTPSNLRGTMRVITSCHRSMVEDYHPMSTATSSRTATATTSTTTCTNSMPIPAMILPSLSSPCCYIQPLLVLDLNGILCHRIRPHREPRDADPQSYRPALPNKVAQTSIIPRPNIHSFMEFLDQHFCLAIWTSAKVKTAKLLVQALIPPPVAQRLLFIWGQDKCRTVRPVTTTTTTSMAESATESMTTALSGGAGAGQETLEPSLEECELSPPSQPSSSSSPSLPKVYPVYEKDLTLVWQQYPAWNKMNTVLMDDSPDKCRSWHENAIHPPPLNGRQLIVSGTTMTVSNSSTTTDNTSPLHPVMQSSFSTVPETIPPPPITCSTVSSMSVSTQPPSCDIENCLRQEQFFQQFVTHWNLHPLVQEWDEQGQEVGVDHHPPPISQRDFFQKHARGHMGWS